MFDSIPITLTGIPAGGTFSGPGINSTNSTFTPHDAGVDTSGHFITYTYGEGNCVWDTTMKVIVECCVVEVLADFPSNVLLHPVKPANYVGIRIAAYPKGGRFLTTSAGLTVETTKGDSAIAWFDAYVAGTGTHIIEYEVVDDYDTCATIKEITVTDGSVQPVDLLSFNVELTENNDVMLTWTTASETNNDFFTVDRSSNAIDFDFMTKVQGSGNTNQEINYTSFDTEPLNGISYYRLSQTDFDGTTEIVGLTYVEIVNENIPLEISKWNINNSTLNIEFKSGSKETIIANIYTSTGQLIYSKEIRNINSILNYFNTDLSSFDQGIYLLRLNNSSEKATLMF